MFADYFYAKKILWTTYVRIFCDGGRQIYRVIPEICRMSYAKHWKLWGFRLYWLGREFCFSFGKDVNGLYSNC